MKPSKFVPFQKKSAAGPSVDPDGIPGNSDDNLPPRKGKKLPPSGKGKKRSAKFAPPWMTKKGSMMSDNDGDEG